MLFLPTWAGMSEMDRLQNRWIGRSEQIKRLSMIFGPPDVPVPPIFVSGNSSTGKSSLVRDMLETLSLPHAFISCVECGSQKMIFESILNQLHGHRPCVQNNFTNFTKCQDLPSFIEYLQGLGCRNRSGVNEHSTFNDDTRYIVFDNAERLRLYDSAFFFSLLRLDELSGINICTIFITNVIRDHFENVLCTRPVLRVHFRDYSQQEAQEILVRESLPVGCEHEQNNVLDFKALHFQFVRMLLDMFWRQGGGTGECRNIAELRRMQQILFPKFIEPVIAREVGATDYPKLFRLLRPSIRQISSKPFHLERLLAIFYSILLDPARPTAEVLSQISGLVSLGLLTPAGGDELTGVKYRCPAPYALVAAVARSLRFDLASYIAE